MSNVEYNFTQEVTLPSKGLLNPEIPEGRIIQRCMMVTDQKFLSGGNRDASEALKQLIQRTVTSPESFDVSNLTLADMVYLLFKLRVLSYGDMYKFKTRCPECGGKIDVEINLSEIPVETLEEGYEEDLVVKLPRRGDTVYIKLLTNRDIEELNKEIKRRKKRSPQDESEYILRIAYSISKIKLADKKEELTSIIDIERYIGSLTDMDASTITSVRDSVQFGISPVIEYTCPNCRNYIDVSLQFSGDFFRPNSVK